MARRRALVTAAFAAVTALVISAAPADAAAPSYVALGDSYSSGTGTRSYLADGTSCLRSVYAYPSLIASARGYALNFRACSGAKISDVTNGQLSALSSSTAYVTISVGGNDAGFADVLTTCAQPAWLSNCTGAVDRAQSYIRNTLPGALSTLYAGIRARAPQAKVTVVGYPRIFNGEDCNLLTWFSPTEESRLNATADLINSTTAARASAAGFAFANPDLPLRRPRRVRQPGVDQRPVEPGRRVLPPQPHGPGQWVHPHGQPLRHRRHGHRHGRGAHQGRRVGRPAGPPAARLRRVRPAHRTARSCSPLTSRQPRPGRPRHAPGSTWARGPASTPPTGCGRRGRPRSSPGADPSPERPARPDLPVVGATGRSGHFRCNPARH